MPYQAYPLCFEPVFRDYIWGGRKLSSHLGKVLPEQGVWAESWELVDHPEHESRILNGELAGQTLGEVMRREANWLVGSAPNLSGRFPLLLKYLDCNRVLSVQVHPDDSYALKMNPPDLGKTEAWYIVDAEPDAVLYAGLKVGVTRDVLANSIQTGKTVECLHCIKPQAGDCVFIPAGTVHALGAGLIVAEIQQASNTTFRLYDWDRVDQQGKSRPLHIDQSLATIDFSSGPRSRQTPVALEKEGWMRLVSCDKFTLDRIAGVSETLVGGDGRFAILTVPKGSAEIRLRHHSYILGTGQSALLPASIDLCSLKLAADSTVLAASVP